MVVVTFEEVSSVGAGPPPPAGLEIVTVNVSPDSSKESSVVCTANVCAPAAAFVNVSVPDFAV